MPITGGVATTFYLPQNQFVLSPACPLTVVLPRRGALPADEAPSCKVVEEDIGEVLKPKGGINQGKAGTIALGISAIIATALVLFGLIVGKYVSHLVWYMCILPPAEQTPLSLPPPPPLLLH
jgi:hypothetical protein